MLACRYLYWSVDGPHARIVRSFLDGSNQTTIVSSGISSPAALSLDASTGDIYWTDINIDSIQVCVICWAGQTRQLPSLVWGANNVAILKHSASLHFIPKSMTFKYIQHGDNIGHQISKISYFC